MPDPNPQMRDGMIGMFELRMRDLSDSLTSGKIDLGTWQLEMRTELRNIYALQVIAATGGDKNAVNPNDWLKLGNPLQQQYRYLADFAQDIQAGKLSTAQIAARAQMYADSAKTVYWRQVTPDFPTYPGEQQCLGNCGCSWVDNGDGSWSWVRGKTDSCEDCINNERTYEHYVPEGVAA